MTHSKFSFHSFSQPDKAGFVWQHAMWLQT